MENNHTPGPWKYDGDNYIRDQYGRTIIGGYFESPFISFSSDKANCKLMAAAPDMLQALQLVLKSGAINPSGKLLAICEDAIKKTTE